MVERGRFPIAVIYVDVDPQAIDVNVHPQKLEVRFSDSGAVFRVVAAALTQVLARTPWVDHAGARYAAAAQPSHELSLAEPPAEAYRAEPVTALDDLPGDLIQPGGYFSRLQPLGQVLSTYMVCAGAEGLVLIDQHAAHERVAYERLRLQAQKGEVTRQQLLFPEVLELPAAHVRLLDERAGELLRWGIEVEAVGPGRFAVLALPAALQGADATALVQDLIDELLEEGPGTTGEDARARILSRCACHAVVRAGDKLDLIEMRALLTALDTVDFGANCPHGRPVYHLIAANELERFFHRR
jgi:DNA mismatch repair protein MutL